MARTTGLECFAGGSSTPKKTAVKKVAKKVAPKKAAPKKVVKKVAPKKVVKKVAPKKVVKKVAKKAAKQTGLAAVPGAKTTNDIFGGLFTAFNLLASLPQSEARQADKGGLGKLKKK